MAKYLTDDEVRDLRRKGKIPHVVPKPTPKDPSVQAIEGIGKALSDHLKAQEREASTFREEIKEVLNVVAVALKDGKEVIVEYPEMKEWQEVDITVTAHDSNDRIWKLKMKKVK